MTKKLTVLMTVAVLIVAALAGCGSGITSGTWYMEDDDESYINFLKDGTAEIYTQDAVFAAEWTEDDGVIELEYDSETLELELEYDSETLELELDGKDTLISDEMDASFERGSYKDVPEFSLSELVYSTWGQDDSDCDLTFYDDDTWDIYDYDKSEYIATGTYELEDGKLTMADDDDNTYSPTMSQNRKTLTISKDWVFEIEE